MGKAPQPPTYTKTYVATDAVRLWGDIRAVQFDFHGKMAGRYVNGVKQ